MIDGFKINTKLNYQVQPRYHGYNNGYANITKCENCGTTGLYEDCHPVNPCKYCGRFCKMGVA